MPLPSKPIIFSEKTHTLSDVEEFRATHRMWEERDIYPTQLKELFEITHPHLLFASDFEAQREQFVQERLKGGRDTLIGNWIYFPWSGKLVHTLNEEEYFLVRTNRNRNLVTEEEQRILCDFTVGLVGLSVGSNVATALAYSGIANTMKIAEFDTLETSNLNRIRARIDQVGMPKIHILAEQVYEVNPYADLHFFSDGITKEALDNFVTQPPLPKLIFEIIDSFEMKIHLRHLAREQRIPVIMVTNLGDSVIIDVERYDLDPATPLFNGRAGTVPEDMLTNPDSTAQDKHKYAVALAGVENIPLRAMESVEQIGKTLVGRPQLTTTVTIAAGFCGYITRKIALGDRIAGSWLVRFENIFHLSNSLK
ncbi:MAG TPA: ThiF family adenylyltransferase [Patescibacteria group bacterium]|nr:ThiF family adenylyltransferase [Patescibacteria group bacterium]